MLDAAVLIANGVDADGHRDVLGCSVSLSEAEVHWRVFLSGIKDRGLHGLEQYVPAVAMRVAVATDIRAIFNAPDRAEADHLLTKFLNRYEKAASKLAQWAKENLPQGFTVFDFPASHCRRLRTTNLLERMNEETRRRTRVARLFSQ